MQSARGLLDIDIYATCDKKKPRKIQAFGSYIVYEVGNQHQNLKVSGHFDP